MKAIIAELARRNVIRVGIAYAAVAWLILQSADLLLDLFGVPGWGIRLIGVVLLIGFPTALVLSWIYELTPDGIRPDPGPSPGEDVLPPEGARERSPTVRRLHMAILTTLIAVGGLAGWQAHPPDAAEQESAGTEASGPTEAPRIAVLPFADLSDTGDQKYFSDGLAEELLNVLARVPGLDVASPAIRSLASDPRHDAMVDRYGARMNEQRASLDLPPVAPGQWTLPP